MSSENCDKPFCPCEEKRRVITIDVGDLSPRDARKAINKLYRQYKKEQKQSTDGEAVASAIISSVIVKGV